MMYYEEGNKRRHLSPDVFVVFGIPKRERIYYLVWDEGKGPDVVIELTSKSTRSEDQNKKKDLYRDVLRVAGNTFLFDHHPGLLRPPLQGFRLVEGQYEPSNDPRPPRALLACISNAYDNQLRLFNPQTQERLATPAEFQANLVTIAQAQAENDRLRQEREAMRKRLEGGA